MRQITLATAQDTEEIYQLYRSQLGTECCVWDENYPGLKEIAFDLGRDALFVMREDQGDGQTIIAAISLDQDGNVEGLPFWNPDLQPGGEVSRLAVRIDCQNQGIAREMIRYAMGELKKRGKKSIHYMVSENNAKAVRSYAHLGFALAGTCEMYGQPYLCYEQEL